MRFKVELAYDGSNYFGWQKQPDRVSIQQVLEEILSQVEQRPVVIQGSGRTDAGVHALGQVFHFDSQKKLTAQDWLRILEGLSPDDLHILKVQEVEPDFHARFFAKSKTYLYRINTGPLNIFERKHVLQYGHPISQKKLQRFADLFLGRHDFGSYNATSYQEMADQRRSLQAFDYFYKGDILEIYLQGDGFLRHMIRVLIGTLLAYNEGKISYQQMEDALRNPSKDKISYKAAAHGLYLYQVDY